jgi:hypothetical protein
MARARKVSHQAVEHYAQQHPEATQTEIGRVFSITQGSVGRILRRVGLTNTHRGVQRKATLWPKGTRFDRFGRACPVQSAEVLYCFWDRYLQQLGCGMSRGEKLGRQRLLYGYDPLQQALQDESATLLDESEGVIEPIFREQHSIERYLPPTKSESPLTEDACL